MALSDRTQYALHVALGKAHGEEVVTAIAAQVGAAAADVAALGASAITAIGATTNLTGVDGTGDNAADLATTEARLDAVEAKADELVAAVNALNTKVDAVLASLKSSGLMASS